MASSVFRTSPRFLFLFSLCVRAFTLRLGINRRLESENARFIIIIIIFLGRGVGSRCNGPVAYTTVVISCEKREVSAW